MPYISSLPHFLLAVILLAVAAVCQGAPPGNTGKDGQQCLIPGQWFVTRDGSHLGNADFFDRFQGRRVFLLGEHHDNADHHRWQQQVIMALAGRFGRVALAVEMLPRSSQGYLDRWLKGELGVNEFLRLVKWSENWHYDPEFYLPIFQFARLNRVPLYAINVERQLIDRVGKVGWDAVPETQREGISKPAPATKDYLRFLASSFRRHQHHSAGDAPERDDIKALMSEGTAFQYFVQSQQLWDRAMAEGIAELLGTDPHGIVIAVMGSGHIMRRFGVPAQLSALGIDNTMVLLPSSNDLHCDELTPAFADAVFALPAPVEENHQRPVLGIVIEPAKQGARIVRVEAKSVAAAAGLHANDLITGIAGHRRATVDIIAELVREMAPGTWLPIEVLRHDKTITLVAKFPSLQ